jgi:hypothetical protein
MQIGAGVPVVILGLTEFGRVEAMRAWRSRSKMTPLLQMEHIYFVRRHGKKGRQSFEG